MAHTVTSLPVMWKTQVRPLSREDPPDEGQALFLSLSAGRSGESGCLKAIPRLKLTGQEEFEASGLSF